MNSKKAVAIIMGVSMLAVALDTLSSVAALKPNTCEVNPVVVWLSQYVGDIYALIIHSVARGFFLLGLSAPTLWGQQLTRQHFSNLDSRAVGFLFTATAMVTLTAFTVNAIIGNVIIALTGA